MFGIFYRGGCFHNWSSNLSKLNSLALFFRDYFQDLILNAGELYLNMGVAGEDVNYEFQMSGNLPMTITIF